MTRNLKALGLALVASLAFSAIAASAASAEAPFWFKSDGNPTVLDGEQELVGGIGDTFTVDGGTVTCKKTTYSGSQIGATATTITINAAYDECSFSGLKAEVHMNGCNYVFHTDTRTEAGTPGGKYDVITTIECPDGKEITVTVVPSGVTKCVVHIPEQNLGTGITLTNATDGTFEDITADISFSNITYTQTTGEGPGKCAATEETHNGTYNGKATITGTDTEENRTSIWVE